MTRLLLRRDHSEKEIREKLGRRYEGPAIQSAISKAKEYGYIRSPEELTERFAEALHRRGRGILKIQFEIQKKGLPPLLDVDEDREVLKAHAHVDKIKGLGEDLDFEAQQKIMRYLNNRGFTTDTIKKVIGKLKNEKLGRT